MYKCYTNQVEPICRKQDTRKYQITITNIKNAQYSFKCTLSMHNID